MRNKIGSIDEILEFAIAREVEACQLYEYLAENMENTEMRKTCEAFAKEEQEHKAKLELEVMKQGQVVGGLEMSKYITDSREVIDMDYKELLVFAIQKEQISVDLYTDLVQIIHDEESRDVLISLLEEEIKHKLRFQGEYDSTN